MFLANGKRTAVLTRLRGAFRSLVLLGLVGLFVPSMERSVLADGNTTNQVDVLKKAAMVAPVTRFRVDGYEITGATLLSVPILTQVLTSHTGTNLEIADVIKAASALQQEYRTRGYPTVDITLPPQQITNGIVRIRVSEGLLTHVAVIQNTHFSSNNVLRALPSLRTNTYLNSHIFTAELDRANGNRDRQIFPRIEPGPEPGTSSLLLEVKDRLPLHGRMELNNLRTPGSPEYRLNGNISYDNLWQLEHSIGFQYGFSPESQKPKSVPDIPMSLFDVPSVANYSLFYRAPLFGLRGVANEIEQDPTGYGYNEATRRFELPPASGRPELSLYGSRSTTDLLSKGQIQNTVDTALLKIDNQIATRSVTRDDSAGLRFTAPQRGPGSIRGNWSLGFDFKSHLGNTFPSNVFYTTATTTNEFNEAVVTRRTTSVPSPAAVQDFSYITLSLGWQGFRPDKSGQTLGSVSLVVGSGAPFMSAADFRQSSGSTKAGQQFALSRLRLSREQNLFKSLKLMATVEGQIANQALVSLEQVGIGGMGSVRGYREGEIYGDDGFFAQFELRSPTFLHQDSLDGRPLSLGTTVSIFTDVGRVFYKEPRGGNPKVDLWGAGIGASSFFGSHVETKLILGWALRDSQTRQVGDFLATFSVAARF